MRKSKELTVRSEKTVRCPNGVVISSVSRINSKGVLVKVEAKIRGHKFRVYHGHKGSKLKVEVVYERPETVPPVTIDGWAFPTIPAVPGRAKPMSIK